MFSGRIMRAGIRFPMVSYYALVIVGAYIYMMASSNGGASVSPDP